MIHTYYILSTVLTGSSTDMLTEVCITTIDTIILNIHTNNAYINDTYILHTINSAHRQLHRPFVGFRTEALLVEVVVVEVVVVVLVVLLVVVVVVLVVLLVVVVVVVVVIVVVVVLLVVVQVVAAPVG
jgi:hypothetical protein